MRVRFYALPLLVLAAATLSMPAQKGGSKGGPKKVELPHPFYVAQVVPIMDKIYSVEDLIPQQEDNGKYEVHIFKAFDVANDKPVAVLNGTMAGITLPLEGDGWTGTIADGHLKATSGTDSIDLQHITRVSPTMGAKPPK